MFRRWATISAGIIVMITNSYATFISAPCDSQKYNIQIGKLDPYACGSTSCPPNVKVNARIMDQADLPIDGWFLYSTSDGKLSKSPIRNHQPVAIPSLYVNPPSPIMLSDDGKMVMHTNSKINDLAGNVIASPAPAHAKRATFWRGKGEKVAWQIQNSDNTKTIYAKTLAGGVTETIGQSLDIHYEFFNVAGTIMCSQRKESTLYNGVLFQLPSSGAASSANMYYPNKMYPVACGMTLSPDGSLLAANYDHARQDCYPTNHKGFAVIPTSKYTGDSTKWMDRSGVSVNFCPESYNGSPLRTGTNTQSEFQNYSWTNKQDWIVCIHRGTSTGVFGVWMVHWKTNTWICLTPRKGDELWIGAMYATAFITQDAPLNVNQKQVRPNIHKAAVKQNALNYWVNLLGRQGMSNRAKGVALENASRSGNKVSIR